MAATLAVFLAIVFFLIQLQPGDYTSAYLNDPHITAQNRQAIGHSFGLDKPAWEQFFLYARNVLRGDLGISFSQYPESVGSIIKDRLPRTLLLFGTATVLAFYLGITLGKVIAWRRGKAVEHVSTVSAVYLYTAFTPWFALLMVWLFAFKLDWFPVGRFISPEKWTTASVSSNGVFLRLLLTAAAQAAFVFLATVLLRRLGVRRLGLTIATLLAATTTLAAIAWWASGIGHLAADIMWHAGLPIITLTLLSFGGVMLLTRGAMLDTVREDYVLAARARGLPDRIVRDRYAARNALLPVVTAFIFSLALAVDGGVIIETVFSWPGMGYTLVNAASNQDLPLAAGAFVFTAIFVLVAHLIVDILYRILDPRLRSP
ncbi:MAG: ABC transporter permease [Chloroflexi bacterium]|nr:ABC transporter permease [Chloroflexota bacterium]